MSSEKIQKFLEFHKISITEWQKLSSFHQDIENIILDYENIHEKLDQSANALSNIIQKISSVHSVRWRVKTPSSLFFKLFRKKRDNVEKYATINQENYRDIITDLVGIRAIHLFKHDFVAIHKELTSTWNEAEPPKAYVRKGDIDEQENIYTHLSLKTEEHNFGYRSVHYIMESRPTKQRLLFEIQVRTIFEEGWSEVDHSIRYPEFNDNPLIINFLNLLNRICGSADEMASFVKNLSEKLKENEYQKSLLNEAIKEKNEELEKKLTEIERITSENVDAKSKIAEMRQIERDRNQQQRQLESLYHSPATYNFGIVQPNTAADLANILLVPNPPNGPLRSFASPSTLITGWPSNNAQVNPPLGGQKKFF